MSQSEIISNIRFLVRWENYDLGMLVINVKIELPKPEEIHSNFGFDAQKPQMF